MSLFDPFPRDEPRPSPPPSIKRPDRYCPPCDVRWRVSEGPHCWMCGLEGIAVEQLYLYPTSTYTHHHTGEEPPV